MRSVRTLHAVDSHTEGMPTRVIVGGVGVMPGDTMAQRRVNFLREQDDLRTLLMFEPRGHSAMCGAILQPPTRPDCDWGVLYIEVSGCLPMCGHGTIGVATVLVETGMVAVVEPVTTIRLDTPAGVVVAEVAVAGRRRSRGDHPQRGLVLPGPGPAGRGRRDWERWSYDIAFGGNFYAMVELDKLGLAFDRAQQQRICDAGLAIMEAINTSKLPVHPEDPDITGCHHVQFLAPGSTARHSRHAMAIYPGWFDRSPCGTGTSARMAQLHARGELPLHTDFVNESFIGTRFIGRLVERDRRSATCRAVVPTITGRAWVTGTAQYLLDPTDPFPAGFRF